MRICFTLLASLFTTFSLAAQGVDPGAALATRERLSSELARLESASDDNSRAQVSMIRSRLTNGDFQAGDRIVIRVDGEPQLTDTFTVREGPALDLPQVGSVTLQGVLRSELTGHLQSHLAKFLRSPVVQVRPLIRILVEGEVAHPGFYSAAPSQALADVLTQAGGLGPRARASNMRLERGTQRLWSGRTLQDAMGRGYSLDQLNLRAGDRVFVPARGDSERTWRVIGLIATLPIAIYSATRIFR